MPLKTTRAAHRTPQGVPLLAVLLAVCVPSVAQEPGRTSGRDRPNVVLVYVDDLGWSDVGYHGTTFYETPHLDRLAARGMRFPNAYANAPNCAPSRASLLSGLYPPRHGVFTVGDPWRGPREARRLIPAENRTTLAPEVHTLAEALQEAGYATAHVGKWHLGEPGEAGPEEQGFDVNVGGTHAGHPPTYFSPYRIETLEDGPPGEYLTDRLTAEALRFIEAAPGRAVLPLPLALRRPHAHRRQSGDRRAVTRTSRRGTGSRTPSTPP